MPRHPKDWKSEIIQINDKKEERFRPHSSLLRHSPLTRALDLPDSKKK